MISLLEQYEASGYRFKVENVRISIEAEKDLLGDAALTEIRSHRRELIRAITLRNFAELVIATAVFEHQILLGRDEILAELDDRDFSDLLTSPRYELQSWAELLAYRLCQKRLGR